ncbi:MAG: VCBS domain-containing protein, partial [Pseudomonadaceae bacterium]|nr:VCBS domain-containing protein [Pseudomonadaceae bacterium]
MNEQPPKHSASQDDKKALKDASPTGNPSILETPLIQVERAAEEAPLGWTEGLDDSANLTDKTENSARPSASSAAPESLQNTAYSAPLEQAIPGSSPTSVSSAPIPDQDSGPLLQRAPGAAILQDYANLDLGTTPALSAPAVAAAIAQYPASAGTAGLPAIGSSSFSAPSENVSQTAHSTVTGDTQGEVIEDQQQTVQGKLQATNPDPAQALFVPGIIAGQYGNLSIDAAGHWRYTLDNNQPIIQALGASDHLREILLVATADGTQKLITVLISGSNDAARITGTSTGDVTEDRATAAGKLETGGQLSVTDIDVGQDHFTAQSNAAGTYGTFSIDTAGHWTYSADNTQTAVQQLKAGATLTDTLTVTSADGTSHTVTVTLNGTNDAPTLTAQTQAVTEDGAKLSGHMVAADVDTGDTQAFSSQNLPVGFTLNTDGSYSFDPADAAYQHLAAGQ